MKNFFSVDRWIRQKNCVAKGLAVFLSALMVVCNLDIKAFAEDYIAPEFFGEELVGEDEAEAGAETDTENEAEDGAEAENEAGAEAENEAGAEAATENEAEAGAETDTENEAGTETDTENEAENGTGTDAEIGAETATEDADENKVVDNETGADGEIIESTFSQVVAADGVDISIEAGEGVFPAGTYVAARTVTDEEKAAVREAVEDTFEGKRNIAESYIWDITFYDADGNAIEPDTTKGGVCVTFSVSQAGKDYLSTEVYHVYEDSENGVPVAEAVTVANEQEGSVSIIATSFSYYLIDFTYGALSCNLGIDSADPYIGVEDILKDFGITATVTAVSTDAMPSDMEAGQYGVLSSAPGAVPSAAGAFSPADFVLLFHNSVTAPVLLSVALDDSTVLNITLSAEVINNGHIHNSAIPGGATGICNAFEIPIVQTITAGSPAGAMTFAQLMSQPAGAYSIYLAEDISITSSLTIPSGFSIDLCLNGCMLSYDNSADGSVIINNGELSIYDCAENARAHSVNSHDGAVTIVGGVIAGGHTNDGAGIYNSGVLRLYGGSIAGNTATYIVTISGGGAGIYNAGDFYMYGGSISYNSLEGWYFQANNYYYRYAGGGLLSWNKPVYIFGGEFTHNYAVGDGAGLFVFGGNGTEIKNAYFAYNLSEQASGHESTGIGAGIGLGYTSAVIEAVTAEYNRAYNGGAIGFLEMYPSNSVEIKNCSLNHNEAVSSAGAVYQGTCPMTIIDTEMRYNRGVMASAVYSLDEATIKDCVISNNDCERYGAVRSTAFADLYIINTDIINNTTTATGSSVITSQYGYFLSGIMGAAISKEASNAIQNKKYYLYLQGGNISGNKLIANQTLGSSKQAAFGGAVYIGNNTQISISAFVDSEGKSHRTCFDGNAIDNIAGGQSYGGALYVGSTEISDCEIVNNEIIDHSTDQVMGSGAAIYSSGNISCVNCIITGNKLTAEDAAAFNNSANGFVIGAGLTQGTTGNYLFNNTVIENNSVTAPAAYNPYAVYCNAGSCDFSGKVIIRNNTVVNNQSKESNLGFVKTNQGGYIRVVGMLGQGCEIHYNFLSLNAGALAERSGRVTYNYGAKAYQGGIPANAGADEFFIYDGNAGNQFIYQDELYIENWHAHNSAVPNGGTFVCNLFEIGIAQSNANGGQTFADIFAQGAGSYNLFLTEDITLNSTLVIPTGYQINLCLNGHSITGNGSGSVILVDNGAQLDIYDCDIEGASRTHTIADGVISGGLITGGRASEGAGIYNLGKLSLYGGTIAGNAALPTVAQSYECSGGGGVANFGSYYMYGGCLKYNTVSGANVPVGSTATIGGGGLLNRGNTFIYGGSIDNNTSDYDGGGILTYIQNKCEINDISLSGNTAVNGGAISSMGSDTRITGVSFIANSAENAGAIYSNVNSGFVSAEYCTFDSNAAAKSGGAIMHSLQAHYYENCTFTNNSALWGAVANVSTSLVFTECSFTNNKSASDGVIRSTGYTLSLTDCTIENNTCTGNGGGTNVSAVSIFSGALFIKGGSISNNTVTSTSTSAEVYGAIYAYSGAAVMIELGTDGITRPQIVGNKSTGNGVVFGAGITAEQGMISNCDIKDNIATSASSVSQVGGAGITVHSGANTNAAKQLIITDSEISGNICNAPNATSYNDKIIGIGIGTDNSNYQQAALVLTDTVISENRYYGLSGYAAYGVATYANTDNLRLMLEGRVIIENNGNETDNTEYNLALIKKAGTTFTNYAQITGWLDPDTYIAYTIAEKNGAVINDITGEVTVDYAAKAYGAGSQAAPAVNDFFDYEGNAGYQVLEDDGEIYIYGSNWHFHANAVMPAGASVYTNRFEERIATAGDLNLLLNSAVSGSTINAFLDADIVTTSSLTIKSGVTLNLCLNGHELRLNGNGSVFVNKGTLAIYDCDEAGNNPMHTITVGNNTVTVAGGLITGGKTNSSTATGNCGGGINSNGTLSSPAKLIIYGGSISGNRVGSTGKNSLTNALGGGGIYAGPYSVFEMYGGTVSYNNVTSDKINSYCIGGGILCAGNANICGGIISDNTIEGDGAGIYLNTAQSRSIANLTVRNNTAIAYTVPSGQSTVGAGGKGGGIAVNGQGAFTIDDSLIDANAAEYAGGIYIRETGNSTPAIAGSVVSNNKAAYYGGGIYIASANVIFTDTDIKNNETGIYGGGIYSYMSGNGDKNVLIDSCNIIDNFAINNTNCYGAGIYMGRNELFNIKNSNISGNEIHANNYFSQGGGIYCDSSLTIDSSVLENNKVIVTGTAGSARGGAIAIVSTRDSSITDSKLNNNVVKSDYTSHGGAIFCVNGNPGLSPASANINFSISNCEIVGNSSESTSAASYANAGAIHIAHNVDVTIADTEITGNSITAYNYLAPDPQNIFASAIGVWDSRLTLDGASVTDNYYYGYSNMNVGAVLIRNSSIVPGLSVKNKVVIRDNYNVNDRNGSNLWGDGNLFLIKGAYDNVVNVEGELSQGSYIGYELWERNSSNTNNDEACGQVTENYMAKAYGSSVPANAAVDDFFYYEGTAGLQLIEEDDEIWVTQHTHSWSYVEKNNQIFAYCTGSGMIFNAANPGGAACNHLGSAANLTNAYVLTLTTPDMIYNSGAYNKAVITEDITTNIGGTLEPIAYYLVEPNPVGGKLYTLLNAAPTLPGNYLALAALNAADGNVYTADAEFEIIDNAAPTGVISLADDSAQGQPVTIAGWYDYDPSRNTFERFYKSGKIVTIDGTDNSGSCSIYYYIANQPVTLSALAQLSGWSAYTGALSLANDSSNYVYAKLVDKTGNYTIIGSEGIVIYTDLAGEPDGKIYTKNSHSKISYEVTSGNNSISAVKLKAAGASNNIPAVTLNAGTDYSVSYAGTAATITILPARLEQLSLGEYELIFESNPNGKAYYDDSSDANHLLKNEAPETVSAELTVMEAGLCLYTNDQNPQLIAGWKDAQDKTDGGLKPYTIFHKAACSLVIERQDEEPCSIFYYLSDNALSANALQGNIGWLNYTEPVTVEPNKTFYAYAELVYASGNVIYISSEGIVLYSDSEGTPEDKIYTHGSSCRLDFEIETGSNTVAEVYILKLNQPTNTSPVNASPVKLTAGVDYIVSYSGNEAVVSILPARLEKLAVGGYELSFESNPNGVSYYDDDLMAEHLAKNEEPIAVKAGIEVMEASLCLYTNDPNPQLIAGWKDAQDKTDGGKEPFTIFHKSSERVVIERPDSEPCSVFYCLSENAMTAAALAGSMNWENYSEPVVLLPNTGIYVYAKLVYASGATMYLSSEGIILYTDAKEDTARVVHELSDINSKNAEVMLNGQRIESVRIDSRSIYTFADNRIKLEADYLDSLAPGVYIAHISYMPSGADWFDDSQKAGHLIKNEMPAETTFVIEIKAPVWKHNYSSNISVNNSVIEFLPSHEPVDDVNIRDVLISILAGDEPQYIKARYAALLGEGAGAFEGANIDASLILNVSRAEDIYSEECIAEYIKLIYELYDMEQDNQAIPENDRRKLSVGELFDCTLRLNYNVYDKKVVLKDGSTLIHDISQSGLGVGREFTERISLTIPDRLLEKPSSGERTYYIARIHEDENGNTTTAFIPYDFENNVISFSADMFSVYALLYTDEKEAAPIVPADPPTVTEAIVEPEDGKKTVTAPKTGDPAARKLTFAALLALISGAVLTVLGIDERRRRTKK